MKKLHLFHIDTTLSTYTYPLVKIVFCIAIILLLIFRDCFIHIDQLILEIIVGVLCTALGFVCIMCIEISFAEILIVYENKSKIKKQMNENTKEYVYFSVDKAISLIGKNDIIDFEIVLNDTCYHVGSSSDSKPGSSVFFDKLYYIGDREFDNPNTFQDELIKYAVDGKILVVTIDGVLPKYYL